MTKKIKIGLIVIEIVLLAVVFIFSMNTAKYNMDFELQTDIGVYDTAEEAIYIDENSGVGECDRYITTLSNHVKKGIYNITVCYKTNTDKNTCIGYDVSKDPLAMDVIQCDEIELIDTSWKSEEYTSRTFRVWIKSDVEEFSVAVNYCGEGYLYVKSINLAGSYTIVTVRLLLLIIICVAVDILSGYWIKKRKENIIKESNQEQIWIRIGLVVIVVLASLPLFVDYLLKGHDLVFHLLRIEGIANGLLSGQFPVRMQPNWLEGYGYPVSVFYGDIMLYLPAILYLLGVPLQTAYKVFVILVNIFTCICTYKCLKRMFRSERTALFGTALYVLSVYRIVDIYIRCSVGEYCAMAFLPLVAYAFWCIFEEENDEQHDKKGYIYLALGLTGVFQTHILSCLMVAIFILLFCLINIRKLLRKKRILQCFKAFIIWLLMNAWFLVPFCDFMRQDFKLSNSQEGIHYIQSGGALIYQLFSFFLRGTGVNGNVTEGIGKDFPLAIGVGFMVVLVIAFGLLVSGEGRKKERGYLKIAFFFSIIALFMSTVYFPYDVLQRSSAILRKVIENIQFPWRFLSIVALFLTLLACICYHILKKKEKHQIAAFFLITVLGMTFISSSYLVDMIMEEGTSYKVYDAVYMHSNAIGGAEYLYKGTDIEQLDNRISVIGSGIFVRDYQKTKNGEMLYVENQAESGSVCLPILYYPGYKAITDDGTLLECSFGGNNTLRITVPEQFAGNILIVYSGMWYWRISDLISLISIVFMGVCARVKKYKKSMKVKVS